MSAPSAVASTKTPVDDCPFNDPASGDFIIRAPSGKKFYVDRSIIVNASPIFRDMFSLPPCSSDGEKPVVDVTESSTVWRLLLQFCYLRTDEPLLPLAMIRILLEAAKKYQMAAVKTWMQRTLSRPDYVHYSVALRTYAIACAYGLPDVARLAARGYRKAFDDKEQQGEELDLISARQYKHLLDYHERCCAAAQTAISDIFKLASVPTWLLEHKTLLSGCNECRGKGKDIKQIRDATGSKVVMYIRPAWTKYFTTLELMMRDQPDPSYARETCFLNSTIRAAGQCGNCSKAILTKMNTFTKEVEGLLEAAISSVKLEIV
ncbi:uncharacterized protein TRAVEDRAFT_52800 [Trametes versicolor FP-101664 SS1]|uniref:uncharacterized protein n=1 Tax=Trametes versicolor (strain FP-101664) TaxID=717944 RepID=UPI0004623FC6|nr:uncharacterized protein TRAVEDRAFT_52800 [Trametes versicolor FP-101664 SS1]EIW53683.1 hypothetical protein TRAVEDRAFT_52800 [Trametes versicolor FP-101664 SS1]